MKPPDSLFDLIHSMSRHEKIFFKRYAMVSGKKAPNYVRLFDVMDSMKVYDEAKMRQKLAKEPYAKRLAFERNYLKNAILESLHIYQKSNTTMDDKDLAQAQVERELAYARILLAREIPDLAQKVLTKAIEEATHYELFPEWLSALTLQYRLVFFHEKDKRKSLKLQGEINEKKRAVAEKIVNKEAALEMYQRVRTMFSEIGSAENPESRKVLEELANHPVLQKENALSIDARGDQLISLLLIYNMLGDNVKMYEAALEKVEMIEVHPHLWKFDYKWSGYTNFIRFCNTPERFEAGKKALENFSNLPCKTAEQQKQQVFGKASAAVFFYFLQQRYESVVELDAEVFKMLAEDTGYIGEGDRVSLYCAFIWTYVILEKHDEALRWFAELRIDSGRILIGDIQLAATLAALVAQKQLNYDSLVSSTCRILKRMIAENKAMKLESTFIHHIQKVPPPLEEDQYWQNFKQVLGSGNFSKVWSVNFSFQIAVAWIDSKIRKRPLREMLVQNLSGER